MTELPYEQQLHNYADIAVKIGVNLQAGQRLIVRGPIEAAPLVRLITASAYQAGARLVDVIWSDDAVTLARFQYAPRDSFEEYPTWQAKGLIEAAQRGDAFIAIHATDPNLLKEQDSDLVALSQRTHQRQLQEYFAYVMSDKVNWCVISYPLASWAARIFPQVPAEQQVEKLGAAIFTICRADQPDPVAAWQAHTQQLAARCEYLNAKQYTALKYTAPGTDLTVGLPENHIWHGGQKETLTGIPFIPNVPTEEVFTMPHKDRVEGVVTSTKPLSYAGVLIENFRLQFVDGKIVEIAAERGEAVLRKLIETDEGAARLGEVALVPQNSPIAQSGVLFYNTLFDENASNHLAVGRAYRFCVENGPQMSNEDFAAAGGNDSLAHVDFMIGSEAMDIEGLLADGTAEPLMRAGEWVS
ncbi:MAG: aminopeptidase [Anaerolineae bacterium]|nr:aminopeptidase [Anaerolineae bacterium]